MRHANWDGTPIRRNSKPADWDGVPVRRMPKQRKFSLRINKAVAVTVLLCTSTIFLMGAQTLINLASQVKGTLGLANGGTNQTSTTIAAHNWFGNNTGSSAAPGYEQPACGDLSNADGGCSMSTTAAGDLSGTLPSANVVSTHISGGTSGDLATFNSTGNMVNWGGSSTCTGSQAIQSLTAAGVATCLSTQSLNFSDNETPTGSCNGSNQTFTLAHTPNPSTSLNFFLNGQLLISGGSDYTLATATVTTVGTCATGDVVRASYRY